MKLSLSSNFFACFFFLLFFTYFQYVKLIKFLLQRSSEVFTSKFCVSSKLFLNSEELIIFCQPFRTAWSSGFNLTSSQTNYKVSNETVLSFTRPMRYHSSPTISFSQVMCGNGFCDGSNLVDFQKQTITGFFINGHLNSFWIGNRQIITNNLNIS